MFKSFQKSFRRSNSSHRTAGDGVGDIDTDNDLDTSKHTVGVPAQKTRELVLGSVAIAHCQALASLFG